MIKTKWQCQTTHKRKQNIEELNVQRILTMMMMRMMTLEMTSKKWKNSLTFPFLLYSGNSSFSFIWLMFYIYIHIIFIIIFKTETLLCVCKCVGKTKQQIESIDRSISKQKWIHQMKQSSILFPSFLHPLVGPSISKNKKINVFPGIKMEKKNT